MDKIILKDKTEIEVKQMTSIGSVTVDLQNVAALQELKDRLSSDNLSEVQTTNADGIVVGNYEGMVLQEVWTIKWTDAGIETVFGLREKTEIEKLREEFAEAQAVQDGAISDLGTAVSEIAEGGAV